MELNWIWHLLKVKTDSKPRNVILNAAMQLFGKQGFNGTSMRDIATAVDFCPEACTRTSTARKHLLEIVADGIGRFLAAVEPQVTASGSPVDRLRDMIKAHVGSRRQQSRALPGGLPSVALPQSGKSSRGD
ncbi:MAG: TetR/AcrR family transcriptional regulator [Sphingomonadales bacterium]|nr:TetR/AcrR family transcriptional regulator [Sphingomonadales bacterium]